MGKLVTVKTGYSYVLLPDKAGSGSSRNYSPGDQVILTDAEYATITTTPSQAGTAAAITLTTSGLPDPYRKPASSVAGLFGSAAATTASGVTLTALGTNVVTGPAGGVTYNPGFLNVAPTNLAAGITGPTPGSTSFFRVIHTQGATASVAPTSKSWFSGTARVDYGTTQSSTTVLDTGASTADVGRTISGGSIPAGTTITAATPGVSFTISAAATTTASNVALTLGPLTRWPGGTVPTFTASAGAVDLFEFVTYDGGNTYVNTQTFKGLA